MTTATQDALLPALVASAARLPDATRAWQRRLRDEGAAVVSATALPTSRVEAWRFLNLAPLKATPFAYAGPGAPALPLDAARPFFLPEAEGARLVFVNGVFSPALSDVADLGEHVVVSDMALAPAALVEAHVGRLASEEGQVFSALNSRFAQGGALVVVGASASHVVLERPIHLLFLSVPTEAPRAAFPRTLVVVGRGAAATLVEEYATLGDGPSFTNAVAEVVVGEDATLGHVRVQDEAPSAFHVARTVVTLARGCRYRSWSVTTGARLSRLDLEVRQTAEGTECSLLGLARLRGDQEADTHSSLDHARPHGRSEQVHKCIVDDAAHAVFNGRIHVRKHAQATDSAQSSRNLLLSERARIDTKPELEIFADDVKCAHGAAVGQLDEDEVFYLKSRGLTEAAARDLLTHAFAAEVVEAVPVASLRERLHARLRAQAAPKGALP